MIRYDLTSPCYDLNERSLQVFTIHFSYEFDHCLNILLNVYNFEELNHFAIP